MIIYPSSKLMKDYNFISKKAKETNEPIYITNNGEDDLVVMSIDTFNRKEKMLKLREELLQAEEDRLHGIKGLTMNEAFNLWDEALNYIFSN